MRKRRSGSIHKLKFKHVMKRRFGRAVRKSRRGKR